uniref:Phospholipid/glycerol acyltransferase domain-containing protein n=1 Tax=Phaeocystis antarctica TaxID=33657 RepID=A0A7S0HNB7_9EUKA
MPRSSMGPALSTEEELASSCRPSRHEPQAGGLVPKLLGHLLFCYTCVMSTLLCPLLALVIRPVAPLLPRPIRGASLFRLVALLWHWSLGIQPLPPLDDAGGVTYLCNHRSMADCYVDIWQCDATVVIRQLAAAVSLLGTVAGMVSGRLLIINRGKTNRTQLAAMSAKHPRLLLYPEGTRRPQATTPAPLRPGGLKNAYEAGHPVRIVMTAGKVRLSCYLVITPCASS